MTDTTLRRTDAVNAGEPPAAPPQADPAHADLARERYRRERIAHWDALADRGDTVRGAAAYYHRRLAEVYRFLIPPGQRILELGCGRGDLLAALQPAEGVGVDFSPAMVAQARERHPEMRFVLGDVHSLDAVLSGTYDAIILSDLVNDLWDVQGVLEHVRALAAPGTRVVVNTYSRLWEPALALAERLGLAQPVLYQNWLTPDDVANLLHLTGFEVIRRWQEVVWPVTTPLVDRLCNRYLVRLWPFRHLGLANFLLARPAPQEAVEEPAEEPLVSVVVAARNEAGNIPQIFQRVPELGGGTELVFVEGHSRDATYEAIEEAIAAHPERRARLLRQPGIGKGDAVRAGFDAAQGEVLMILDADLTVPPEDLPRFYDALRSGRGEFINGVRLVYPMEREAMRFWNLLGNKFFSLAFSWLLGQPVKDTLCGTKVLWRKDYQRLAANRAYFGDFDPFGDFDLLFGAAKLGLRIIDLPIRYRERTYGTTNIDRWRHGWLLLRMVAFAASRIKFV
jgi:SAM-dependent methyltransferase